MTRRNIAVVCGILFAGAAAFAATADPRGWSVGQPAVNAARLLAPLPESVYLEFPTDFQKRLHRETVIIYFSPTCPHCQAAAPELARLATQIADRADVIGVVGARANTTDIAAFSAAYNWTFPVIKDETGDIAKALQVDSTPSVVLVKPEKKRALVVDFWYPYVRGYNTLIEMRLSAKPFDAFRKGEYHGNATCAACHAQEYDSWGLSHHSIAWYTLTKKSEQHNGECTNCHVTGAGQPTGWDGDVESTLVDVGCEACHGPGGPHDGERQEASTACAGCHDPKHSIAFTYEKGLPLIDHYSANILTEAEWRDQRRALGAGEKPKALLAFAAGKSVGAAACAACHADEHAQWAGADHSKAMGQLKGKDAEDPTCVRCHATPPASGPLPVGIAGFRVDEGVGCESCHGPGEAHVASKGAPDTIEGLGDDCPVCVIEAVCTNCHTPTWDKTFDLDVDLPLVAHRPKTP